MRYTYKATLKELDEIAGQIITDAGNHRIFALKGELGAGKTTLIQYLCKKLGVEDVVNSPTFAIMNEYRRLDGEPVFHFDFYRIKSVSEAYDLGYEQFFFSNNYCFIEWPEKIESLLNFPKATIFITSENGPREILMLVD